MFRGPAVVLWTLLVCALSWPRDARAWYFPEHSEITRIALTHYAPPPTAEIFRDIIDLARIGRPIDENQQLAEGQRKGDEGKEAAGVDVFERALPLCEEPGTMLHEVPLASCALDEAHPRRMPLDGNSEPRCLTTPYARCIPYGALPALAADHAVTLRELMTLLTQHVPRGPLPSLVVAGMVTGSAVEAWNAYRRSAPIEFTRVFATPPGVPPSAAPIVSPQLNRTKIVRDLDARILLVDHDYTTRAGDNRTHFHQSTYSVGDLLEQLQSAGVVDNALNQLLTHQMRSVVLALEAADRLDRVPQGRDRPLREICHSQSREAQGMRECLEVAVVVRLALLSHAFALHFMEDGFSSGHIGTEHGVSHEDTRVQRHDYLCRAGLSVTRALAAQQCASSANDFCWTAFGDGYLDADTLPYVAQAVARMQLQFAAAFRYGDSGFWAERWGLDTSIDADMTADELGSAARSIADTLERAEAHLTALLRPATAADPATGKDRSESLARLREELSNARARTAGLRGEAAQALRRKIDAAISAVLAASPPGTAGALPANAAREAEALKEAARGDVAPAAVAVRADAWAEAQVRVAKARETAATLVGNTCRDSPACRKAADYLTPIPAWTLPSEILVKLRGTQESWRERIAPDVARGFLTALRTLRTATRNDLSLSSVREAEAWSVATGGSAGAATRARDQARALLGEPLVLCRQPPAEAGRDESAPPRAGPGPRPFVSETEYVQRDICYSRQIANDRQGDGGATRIVVGFGSVDISLWRPLLVVWPTARMDVRTIDGLDPFGRGLAYQVTFGANVAWNAGGRTADGHSPVMFGIEAAVGLAYRFDSLLAGRDNRSVFEINVGMAPTVLVTSGWQYATMAFLEARLPVAALASLALGYATRSADAVGPARASWGIGVYGARVYTILPTVGRPPELRLAGWDLELAYLSLPQLRSRRGASTGGLAMDPELRLRLGGFNEQAVFDGVPGDRTSFMVGLEFSAGFSWFFWSQ